MSDDLRPLTSEANDTRRGLSKDIHPGQETLLITGFSSACVRAELIGVVLGLCPIDVDTKKRCWPGDDDGADLTADAFSAPGVRAEITWGIGSATFQAVCDYIHGTVVAVVAENVRVCASYVDLGCCPDRCSLPSFNVSAGFGYIARSANSNPARLTKSVKVAPGAARRLQVPPFAISLTCLPIEDAPVDLRILGACGGQGVRYKVETPLSNTGKHLVENALPLFNGARYVEVTNPSATDEVRALVIFGLAL